MIYEKLKELIEIKQSINITQIHSWLMKHEKEFLNAINTTTCRKWSKCFINNEKPFPCVCSIRVQDCIFIETYFKLKNVLVLYEQQQYFMELGLQYNAMKDNEEDLKVFNTIFNALGDYLGFETQIIISLNTEPYEKIVLQLNEKEFEGIIELQNIFN